MPPVKQPFPPPTAGPLSVDRAVLIDAQRRCVAAVSSMRAGWDQAQADAAELVRRWNAHTELIEALDDLLHAVDGDFAGLVRAQRRALAVLDQARAEKVPAQTEESRPMEMTTRPTPPLKWHGGKHYLARRVIELMPPHLHYVEPYFGGGQVFFTRDPADRHLWWPEPTSDGRKPSGVSEVINDLHRDLMSFYAVLKDRVSFARLAHCLSLTLHSESEWDAAGALLAGPEGDPIDRAAAFFTRCRQSLSGRLDTFAPTVRSRLRGGRNDGVNGWWNAIDGLKAVHRRLQSAKVLCRPALEVIRSEDTPATLFYCDPPYYHPTRTAPDVYAHEMSEADHRQLLDVLRTCQGKVILSGYASDLYDQALAGWTRHMVEVPNNAASGAVKRRMVEVLWCNF